MLAYMLLHRGICIFGALIFSLTLLFTILWLSVFVPFLCPVFHWLAFVLAFASLSHLPLAKIFKNAELS